jgi:hypothetical protein
VVERKDKAKKFYRQSCRLLPERLHFLESTIPPPSSLFTNGERGSHGNDRRLIRQAHGQVEVARFPIADDVLQRESFGPGLTRQIECRNSRTSAAVAPLQVQTQGNLN